MTHDIASAGGALRSGATTSQDLTEFYLDRIAEHADLGAYVTVAANHALAAARKADVEIAAGHRRGPLHGIPIALKDLIDTDFAPTTVGMPCFHDRRPACNAAVVDRLEAAGAVILGKLAMTEGAYMAHALTWPAPRNPWSPAHWTGVSSSGSGVAVAADLCLAALGSDTGGSIRLPSAACGVTGLKPTYGLVSLDGVFPLAADLDHLGPMARSARDAAALLGAMTEPGSDYLASLCADAKGLRIGVDEAILSRRIAPEVSGAMQTALRQLESRGATLVPVTFPPVQDAMQAFATLVAKGAAAAHTANFPGHEADYGAELAALIRFGQATDEATSSEARRLQGRWCDVLAPCFTTVDMLALPALPIPVPSLAELSTLAADPAVGIADFTIPFDVSGNPTITFPIGADPAGLPIAMQLVAPHFAEQSLLDAAHAYQSATDWHLRTPPGI